MSTIAKDKGGEDFEPVPQGIQIAICIMVIDGGTHFNERYGTNYRQIKLVWEIPGQTIMINGEPMPMTIQQNYTNSLSKKANLRKALENWRGVAFTEEELQGFDVKRVIGKACQINVIHNINGEKIYANIGAILPIAKGMDVPKHTHDLIYFDLDEKTEQAWAALPQWIQNWISKSNEMKAVVDGVQVPTTMGGNMPVEAYEEDIPF